MSLQSINTGLSGLISHSKALDVTGNNIANYNNPEYHKRTVKFSDNPIRQLGDSAGNRIGTGSHIQSISRVKDEFLYNSLNNSKAQYELYKDQSQILNNINNILQNEDFLSLYDNFFMNLRQQVDEPKNPTLKKTTELSAIALNNRARGIQDIFQKQIQDNISKGELKSKEIEIFKKEKNLLNKEIEKIESLNEYKIDKTFANSLRDKRDSFDVKIYEYSSSIKSLEESSNYLNKLNNIFTNKFEDDYLKIEEWVESEKTSEDGLKLLTEEEDIKTNHNEFLIEVNFSANSLNTMMGSTETIMNNLQNRYDEKSKVNLDEELTNQIRFQRAYEANAIVVRTGDEMIKTLLNMKQ